MRHVRRALDDEFQVLHRGLLAGKQRIGKGLAEIGNQPVAVVIREARNVERELRGEREQDRRGHMPLVGFELRQVAHRNAELSRQPACVSPASMRISRSLRPMKSFFARMMFTILQFADF